MPAIISRAIVMRETGGPEVLKLEQVDIPEPGPGEVRLSQSAVGVNFSETRTRAGASVTHANELPLILGREAAGVIDALGPDVTGFKIGQRVAYGLRRQQGAYAEARLIPAFELVPLPDAIDDATAAAIMVKGMTACYLCRRTYDVGPGDAVLIHAAAGGVGSILTQWCKHLGATVIGCVSTQAKADYVLTQGCDHAINYKEEDVAARVRQITNGGGVQVVYDPVGKDTWDGSFKSLAVRGLMVNYGWASGRVTALEPLDLMDLGSLTFTKTALHTYANTPENMRALASEIFEVVQSGDVKINIGQTYALKDAAQAHSAIEARKTTGSTVLLTAGL